MLDFLVRLFKKDEVRKLYAEELEERLDALGKKLSGR